MSAMGTCLLVLGSMRTCLLPLYCTRGDAEHRWRWPRNSTSFPAHANLLQLSPQAFTNILDLQTRARSITSTISGSFGMYGMIGRLLCCVQGRTREQLAAASVEAEACRSQLEVSHAKLQRLERSNAHLRKQRAQMMADLQVPLSLLYPCLLHPNMLYPYLLYPCLLYPCWLYPCWLYPCLLYPCLLYPCFTLPAVFLPYPCCTPAAPLPYPALPLLYRSRTPAAPLLYPCCTPAAMCCPPAVLLMHPCCMPAVLLLRPCCAPAAPLLYVCCTPAGPVLHPCQTRAVHVLYIACCSLTCCPYVVPCKGV